MTILRSLKHALRNCLSLNHVIEVRYIDSEQVTAPRLRQRARSLTVSYTCLMSRSGLELGRMRDILAGREFGTAEELASISNALDAIQRDRLRLFELADRAGFELGGRVF
jgi:hypothetical protein